VLEADASNNDQTPHRVDASKLIKTFGKYPGLDISSVYVNMMLHSRKGRLEYVEGS
jgi:hypothetical protein